ncbi:hypothetical protein SBBP2_1320003 [Burkholderiales bacterium]|nr:hypothetical protein SBBP2_1320003 [Burkholderiales bacterium]
MRMWPRPPTDQPVLMEKSSAYEPSLMLGLKCWDKEEELTEGEHQWSRRQRPLKSPHPSGCECSEVRSLCLLSVPLPANHAARHWR